MAEKVIISFEVDSAGAISKITQVKKAIGEDVPAATTKASSGFSTLKTSLSMVGAAFAALGVAKLVGTLANIGGQAIQTGAKFETMAIQMRAVTGSSLAAGQAMDWIREFTLTTPYQMEQVTGAFIKLRAMGFDPMTGVLQAVADATSYLGGNIQTMDSLTLALGKSMTVGKMGMEEMRMMMEQGVPVIDLMAKALGKTSGEIINMSAKGQLGRQEIQALVVEMQNFYGGASQALMDTFAGKWSNLQDQIQFTFAALSDAGVLDLAKVGLDVLIDVVTSLRTALEELGTSVDFSGVIDEINDLRESFSRLADNVNWDNIKAGFAILSAFFTTTIMSKIREGTQLINGFARGLENIKNYGPSMAAFFAGFNDGMRETVTVMVPLVASHKTLAEKQKEAVALGRQLIADAKLLSQSIQNRQVNIAVLNEKLGEQGKAEQLVNDLLGEGWQLEETMAEQQELRSKAAEDVAKSQRSENAEIDELLGLVESLGVVSIAPPVIRQIDEIGVSFSDLISKGFTGQLDSFADIAESIFADVAKSMATIFANAFNDIFLGEGGSNFSILGKLKAFWYEMKKSIEENQLGSAISGAGGIYAGYQQGGVGGFLQGAMGGMQLGGSIGSLFGPGGTGIGMGIGAALGGVASLFGGEDDPRVYGHLGLGGHQVYQSDTDLSTKARAVWANERINEYRASIMQMNNVLRIFEDGTLFDLIGDAGDFTFDEGDLGEITAIFSNEWLPQAMRQMFRGAIDAGLNNFGVDEDTRKQLWKEVRTLSGTDQIAALENYVSALVNTSHLLDDMSWDSILDETRQDSMSSFLNSMADALSGVRNQMLGFDDMSLLERATQAQTIEQMIVSARQAEIQMLQQIDQMQKSINDSIDAQIEGLRVGGMSEGQQQQYYLQQIQDIMAQLRAGVSSPETLQALMADLQRYTGAYGSSLGDALYTQSGFGGTEADWIIGILEEARGLSNDAFDAMRDQIKESNDALIAELQNLITALQHYGDTVATGDTAQPALDVNGTIDVNVSAGDGFWAEVDARFDYNWMRRQQMDQGIN